MSRRGVSGEHEVIVKRRPRKVHQENRSGAWKVAFADFTLAMMALFMVLWIVNPRNPMSNPALGEFLTNPLVDGGAGVFEGTSRDPLELDGVPLPRADQERGDQEPAEQARGDAEPERWRQHLESAGQARALLELLERLGREMDAEANLEVSIVPQGLRILLKDDQRRFMFPRGSARLEPHFRRLLEGLAAVLATVDNKLIIGGHTDAVPYRGDTGYDNWNLSGDRALSARRALQEAGLAQQRLLQVSAYADGMPLRPEAPEDGANRRVEILLLTDRAERLYRELFDAGAMRAQLSEREATLQPAKRPPGS